MLHFTDNVGCTALRYFWAIVSAQWMHFSQLSFAVEGTKVHHVGGMVDGVFLDMWSRGSFLLDNWAFLITWGS
jgi:hypothetical protein